MRAQHSTQKLNDGIDLVIPAFRILCESCIVVAVLEAVIWEGVFTRYFWFSVGTAATIAALYVFRRLYPPSLSVLLVAGATGSILFRAAVAIDEWNYCALAGDSCAAFGPTDIVGWVAVLSIGISSWFWPAVHRWERWQCRIVSTLSLILLTLIEVSALVALHPRFSFDFTQERVLCILFALIIPRCLLARTRSSEILVLSRARVAVCGVTIGGVLLSFGYALYLQYSRPFPKLGNYRISMKLAVPLLVSEDPLFMRHHGVDFSRIRNAIREAFEKGRLSRGGSTITMQLAKVSYLTNEKTLLRKFNQMMLALSLEIFHSKSEILGAYLEAVPFAPGVTGIAAAARSFFDTSAENLSQKQFAQLIVTIFDPTVYNPGSSAMPQEAKFREITIRAQTELYGRILRNDLKDLDNMF